MKATRSYTMTARAAATERTRHAILDATLDLASTRLVTEISLESIAAAAQVSVQTVLRHFGSRAGLIEEVRRHGEARILDELEAPVGDVVAAVRAVAEHYETRGDGVTMMLAQEHADPVLATMVARGREVHRDWVRKVFAPQLAESGDVEETLDLLAVATDVYTWKQLRRDRFLSRDHTEARMLALVDAVLRRPDSPRRSPST